MTSFILRSEPHVNLLLDYTLNDIEKELESSLGQEKTGSPSLVLSESGFLIQGLELEEEQ